jgi:hypothetical protein
MLMRFADFAGAAFIRKMPYADALIILPVAAGKNKVKKFILVVFKISSDRITTYI